MEEKNNKKLRDLIKKMISEEFKSDNINEEYFDAETEVAPPEVETKPDIKPETPEKREPRKNPFNPELKPGIEPKRKAEKETTPEEFKENMRRIKMEDPEIYKLLAGSISLNEVELKKKV